MSRDEIPNDTNGNKQKITKGTWVFKLKRLETYKLKEYTILIHMFQATQWSTFFLILTMVFYHGWTTKQVDYTNTFSQAEIK